MTLQAIIFCICIISVQSILGKYVPTNLLGSSGAFSSQPRLLSPREVLSPEVFSSRGVLVETTSGFGGSAAVFSGGASCGTNSISPIAADGVSVAAALDVIGEVLVSGVMPFASAVGFETVLPSIGTGSVAYVCGDGPIGIDGVTDVCGINGIGATIGNSYGGRSGACYL